VLIVLLDSQGKMTRIGDANRIKRWLEAQSPSQRTQPRITISLAKQ
jgi:D-alanyl-D-alanine endopeptidase (penicillin-binding protein 7)